MKSWITFQRAPRIQPRRRSDEHCRRESRRFPRVGLAASATPMPRRRIKAVVTAEVELQTGTPPFTLNTRVGSSCRIQFGENCRLPFFCLCHFLYICGGDSTLSGSTLNDVLAVGVQQV
jgi:hypothetical protein